MKRKCVTCGECKDENEFYKDKRGYYISYCNGCRRLYNRDYKHIRTAREKDKMKPII